MPRVEPAGGLFDVVDVVDLAVLRHRLLPAVRQRPQLGRVAVVVVHGRASLLVHRRTAAAAAAGRPVSRRLLRHAPRHVLVPDGRRAATAATSSVTAASRQHTDARAECQFAAEQV